MYRSLFGHSAFAHTMVALKGKCGNIDPRGTKNNGWFPVGDQKTKVSPYVWGEACFMDADVMLI